MTEQEMTVSNCNDWKTHTPGPWKHGETTMTRGRIYGGGVLVATLDPAQFEEEVAMKAADARLIAAAPELLAALHDMLDRFEDHEQYDRGGADAAAINIARAAIAKAKGGAE